MQKSPQFSKWHLLLIKKQKKPFVLLNNQVTLIGQSLTTALLAQVDKALKGPGIEFIVLQHGLDTRSANFFLRSVSLLPSKTKISI